MTIRGSTALVAHIGFPTHNFKSPVIYNPYFEEAGIDAVLVPMGCRAEHFARLLGAVFTLTNIRGALITMPHKMAAAALVDDASLAVHIAGSCNAVRRLEDGRLYGDLFDGEGFTRALTRKHCRIDGARALVIGAGGVGSAIAASLAAAGTRALALFDVAPERARALADRLAAIYPDLHLAIDSNDPSGQDIVINATPMGTADDDALPVEVERLEPGTWVGDVVMSSEMTPFLLAAQARGCLVQVGVDMLFEQIPLYLAFFGFPPTTPEHLRQLAAQELKRESGDNGA